MFEVLIPAQVESYPTRVWNPAVLLSKAVSEQNVMNWTRKGDVNGPAAVDMPDLCTAKAEFFSAKAVGMN